MIILVRHGEATHHTQHLTGGWTDSDLTEAGRSQLEALAEKLALDFKGRSEKFRILASDLKRAAESAAIIAARLHMDGKVEKHAFLREKNNGLAAKLQSEFQNDRMIIRNAYMDSATGELLLETEEKEDSNG